LGRIQRGGTWANRHQRSAFQESGSRREKAHHGTEALLFFLSLVVLLNLFHGRGLLQCVELEILPLGRLMRNAKGEPGFPRPYSWVL
jgi:hypothetical protein